MTKEKIEQKAKEIANKYVSLGFKCSFSNELYEAAMDMAEWLLGEFPNREPNYSRKEAKNEPAESVLIFLRTFAKNY